MPTLCGWELNRWCSGFVFLITSVTSRCSLGGKSDFSLLFARIPLSHYHFILFFAIRLELTILRVWQFRCCTRLLLLVVYGVLLFSKALVAETTAEGMRVVVQVHGRLELGVAHESLSAAWILADILLFQLVPALLFQSHSALAGWTRTLRWSLYLAGVCESPLFKHPVVHISVLPRSWRSGH